MSSPQTTATSEPEVQEEIVSTQDTKRHLLQNVLSKVILFVFGAATSIYFVPYQIHHLGIANYGIVTLTTQVVSWTSILSMAIVGTIGRFVMINLARKDWEAARSYFNTQYIAILVFTLVMIPAAIVISYLTPTLFHIPAGQANNSRLLFFFAYLCFLMTTFSNAFRVAAYVKQRLYIRNYLEISEQASGYAVWIIMFSLVAPSIWHIGFGRLIGATVVLLGSIITFNRLTPQLSPSLHGFDWSKFKETAKMGTWMTFGRAGSMLFIAFDAVIINEFLGSASVGRYGTLAGLSAMLRTFVYLAWSIMGPPAIAYSAKEDWKSLLRITTKSVRLLSLVLAIGLGVFCGMSRPLLTHWLGPEFTSLNVLAWLMFSQLVVTQGIEPLFSLNYARNKMSLPAIATILGGLLKISLAVLLMKYTRLGLYGIAIADMAALGARNLVFGPIYASHIMYSPRWPLYKSLLPSIAVFAVAGLSSLWIARSIHFISLAGVAGTCVLLCAVIALPVYFVLPRDDRETLRQVLLRGKG